MSTPYAATSSAPATPVSSSLVNWTTLIYALHAFSLVTGLVTTATVIGAFLTGWPSILAVILNYVKRGEARGTWIESHFRWQIRTFWYALLWCVVGWVFIFTLIGVFVGLAVLGLAGLWVLYRVARGWWTLGQGETMPMPARSL